MTLFSLVAPLPLVCGAVSALTPVGPRRRELLAKPRGLLGRHLAADTRGRRCRLVFAWLCYRRQRQYGMPWTPAWVVFVFPFGLPGYIGYRTHRRWPTCLPCPSCGRMRRAIARPVATATTTSPHPRRTEPKSSPRIIPFFKGRHGAIRGCRGRWRETGKLHLRFPDFWSAAAEVQCTVSFR